MGMGLSVGEERDCGCHRRSALWETTAAGNSSMGQPLQEHRAYEDLPSDNEHSDGKRRVGPDSDFRLVSVGAKYFEINPALYNRNAFSLPWPLPPHPANNKITTTPHPPTHPTSNPTLHTHITYLQTPRRNPSRQPPRTPHHPHLLPHPRSHQATRARHRAPPTPRYQYRHHRPCSAGAYTYLHHIAILLHTFSYTYSNCATYPPVRTIPTPLSASQSSPGGATDTSTKWSSPHPDPRMTSTSPNPFSLL